MVLKRFGEVKICVEKESTEKRLNTHTHTFVED